MSFVERRQRSVAPQAVAALLAASFLGSCDHAPLGLERDLEAFLQTDLLAYDVESRRFGSADFLGFSVEYEFTNRSDRLIHVLKCDAINFRLEKREGDGWTEVWEGPDHRSCLPAPVVVEPGGTLNGDLQVEGWLPPAPFEGLGFETDRLTGYFRLALAAVVYPEAPGQERTSVELERRISNAFRLRAR